MPNIRLKGVNLYYELHGNGKPLVLLAGYTCDHNFWNAMLDGLARQFQVLLLDNRGIGQTKDNGSPFTLEDLADDTMTLVEQLGLKQPHILGQSMGGAIAQIIAKKYPDKINRLIILNSVGKFSIRTLKAIESLLDVRKKNVSLDLLIEASLPWFFSNDYLANPKNIASFKEMAKNNPYPQSIEDQERQFRALLPFDSRSWLQEIKADTLVIAAKEDIVALPEDSQTLAKSILGAEFITIPDGHSSPLEQPKEVNKVVLDFLQ